MSNQGIRKVVILGGTAEAFMAAWAISRQYRKDRVSLTILDTGAAGDESNLSLQQESLPIFARFQINEKTLVENVQSSYKLGTQFLNWSDRDASVFQPIGTHGGPMDLVAFESYATKKKDSGQPIEYNDYSLGANAALAGKFVHPQTRPGTIVSTLGYALHLDVGELRAWLKSLCVEQDVEVRDVQVASVDPAPDDASVSRLHLDDGSALDVDLLVDCSNRVSNQFSDALSVGFESWSRYFPNDRRVTFTKPAEAGWKPLTSIEAHANGLIRQSPLESSTRGEFYFASAKLSESEALDFLRGIEPGVEVDPSAMEFAPGIRESAWVGNYVALGKTYGQYEPLDGSNFHGFLVALERLLDLFPRTDDCKLESREFNRKTRLWYENMRDFNLMRYVSLQFSDIDQGNTEGLPKSFGHKLELFIKTAKVPYLEEEPFPEPYRVSSLINMGVWPESYDVLIDRFDFEKLDQRFEEMKRMIASTVSGMPNHLDYVKRLLASQ